MGAQMRIARLRIDFLLPVILMTTHIAGCGGSGSGDTSASSGSTSTVSAFGSCPRPSSSSSPAGSVGSIVDGLVANEMQVQELPGMEVALAKQGSVIYAQGYGYADLSDCAPMQADTPFQLDSVTKTFTAAAILQLQSTGALDIDNPVIRYLPDYPFDPRITVRMLLNQISALPDYINDAALFPETDTWVTQGVAEQSVLTAIAQAPLQFIPGSEYQYSNSNYFVLGSIIEVVTSESYPLYLATNIIGPLGLSHTSYTQPLAGALPYMEAAGQAPVAAPIFARSAAFAAGALWSNVQDLASFDAALFSGRVLPTPQFMQMVTPPPSVPRSSYAMGWSITTLLNRPFAWHNGGSPGSAAFNGLFLDDGFSISILSNARPPDIDSFALQMIQAVCASAATTC
jgi:CubicO group peptidase (beta-lactamase class C family)